MISVTALSSYLYCPRKLFLEKVLKIVEPPKEALVRGSIRHSVYEGINKIEEKIVKEIKKELPFEEIKEIFKSEYSRVLVDVIKENKKELKNFDIAPQDMFKELLPLVVEESEIRAENIFNFIEENKIFGDDLWEKLTPKILSEFWVESENIGLRGIVDQIEMHNSSSYIPIELKTGKMPDEGVWPGHKIQIAAYMLLLEEKFKTSIGEGKVRYLDAKETRIIKNNPFLREEILGLINKVLCLLKSKELPAPAKSENKCLKCGLREECLNEKKLLTALNAVLRQNSLNSKHLNSN